MSDVAVRVENLSKAYRISRVETTARYRTLREDLVDLVRRPFRRGAGGGSRETIWALKDVSLEIKQGEVIGIIGRNGAGKSTLLKILSRITEPTSGHADVFGRVGSLLEVGTGFHPELTGRENIYLNGAILGMRKGEIDRKFDEIVAFAEIEQFLDTPVKRYSSGMYVRLAFAVAAHLEPEILLVDEVLAVGDAAFQKKCLGKMGDVAKEGRTVLFVSHSMPAVQRLCQKVYLVEQGRIVRSGDTAAVIETYYKTTMEKNDAVVEARETPAGTVRYLSWQTVGSSTGDLHGIYSGEPCTFRFELAVKRVVKQANFGIALWANDGTLVWAMRNLDNGGECVFLREGRYELQFAVPQFPLRPGSYQLHVSANDLQEGTLDSWYAEPKLQVIPKHESGLPPQWQGVLNISGEFRISLMSQRAAEAEYR